MRSVVEDIALVALELLTLETLVCIVCLALFIGETKLITQAQSTIFK